MGGNAAFANFMSLGPSDRLSCSHHVFAYYLDTKAAFAEDGFEVDSMPDIASAEAVWAYVQPKLIFVKHDHYTAGKVFYVGIEANCDWEPEHGLMLCFREGKRLSKCGGYDDHVTNRNAYADDSLVGIVYKALDPMHTTSEDQ